MNRQQLLSGAPGLCRQGFEASGEVDGHCALSGAGIHASYTGQAVTCEAERDLNGQLSEVRKTPSWPRIWANSSLLQLYSHRHVWANLHLLGQPNTFLAPGLLHDGRGRGRARLLRAGGRRG
jgi:hypothetical protein